MRKSDLQSLIDLMGGPQPPSDDDAPKIQSLLRPVEEMTGAAGQSDWFDGAATPKAPPEGRIRAEAGKPKPLSGDIQSLLPSVREVMGVETPDGEEPKPVKTVETYSLDAARADEDILLGLLARLEPTKDDLNTLVSVADDLKRQKEADPDAFAKQPEIARKFLTHFEATKSGMLDSLLRQTREQGREPTPKQLADLDKEAAAIAQDGANTAMTRSAAARTAGNAPKILANSVEESGRALQRGQEFSMAGLDPVIVGGRPDKWQSQDDLKKALAAAGPGAFVVGVRPLPLNLYRDPQARSRADVENREAHHKHIFYLDADGTLRDAGYFGDGIRKGGEGRDKRKDLQAGESDELDNLGRYHFGDIQNGGNLRPEMFDLKGFDASNYRLLTHNCQTYVEAVQKRLRRTRGRAPQE
jgi:hypothetical protein